MFVCIVCLHAVQQVLLLLTIFYKLLFFDVLLAAKHVQVLKRPWNLKQIVHSRIHQPNAYKLEEKKAEGMHDPTATV
jgi:hypothetical protein